MGKYYLLTERFVIKAFTKTSNQIKHFLRTEYWLKILKPDADEALLIAAIAHDIERAFRQKDVIEETKKGFTHLEFLRKHEERGGEIMAEFLKKQGADDKLIQEVKILISRHEEGGSENQNLLKDADSLSFFENNVNHFITIKVKEVGKEKVKEKFDWMYHRITSQKAKKLARLWYEEAIGKLGN